MVPISANGGESGSLSCKHGKLHVKLLSGATLLWSENFLNRRSVIVLYLFYKEHYIMFMFFSRSSSCSK